MTEAEEREHIEVEPVIPPQFAGQLGGTRPQTKSFAAATADASGMTKQAINRHLARAEALGDDLDKVTGTIKNRLPSQNTTITEQLKRDKPL